MKRDVSLDFWRGLACIAVIAIHTVFHSGNSYVPRNISCWFLLFDIPVFMYITGMTYYLKREPEKKLNEIIKLLKKWIIFIIICYIFLLIFDYNSIKYKDFFSWIVFKPNAYNKYTSSLAGSLWFMIYFVQSSIFCSILLKFIKNNSKTLINVLLLLFFILISINTGINYFGFTSCFIGYCIFFLIGYIGYNFKFKNFKIFLITEILLIIGLFILFHVNNYTIANLQDLKMNMNYIYVFISLISLIFITYIRDKLKYKSVFARIVSYVGKNAFYMFFAQGISASLLYLILPYVNVNNLYLKILCMFMINLVISSVIFTILNYIYKFIDYISKKINIKKLIFNNYKINI